MLVFFHSAGTGKSDFQVFHLLSVGFFRLTERFSPLRQQAVEVISPIPKFTVDTKKNCDREKKCHQTPSLLEISAMDSRFGK